MKTGMMAALTAAAALWITACTPASPAKVTYEYKTERVGKYLLPERLNQLGAEGWEVITSTPVNDASLNGAELTLKRPKP